MDQMNHRQIMQQPEAGAAASERMHISLTAERFVAVIVEMNEPKMSVIRSYDK